MTEKLPVIKCACSCGFKHYNAVPCKIQTLEIPLSPSVLAGSVDLIVQVFLFESPLSDGVSGPQCVTVLPDFTSQFSAISLHQRKITAFTLLNDASGNLSPTSAMRWTMQAAPSPSVERYRLHVASLPASFDLQHDAKLVVQFWRSATVDGKSQNQKLSSHCPEITATVAANA